MLKIVFLSQSLRLVVPRSSAYSSSRQTFSEFSEYHEFHEIFLCPGGQFVEPDGKKSGLTEHPFGTLKRWCGWDHFLLQSILLAKKHLKIKLVKT
jgi:hypothetical protein